MGSTTAVDTPTSEVTFDDLMDALGHIERRKLLSTLQRNHAFAHESVPIDVAETSEADFPRLVQMTHVHLPKLEDFGFITWERETNSVSTGPTFEEVRPLLELFEAHGGELHAEWL